MRVDWKPVFLALSFMVLGGGALKAPAQEADWGGAGDGDRDHRELHIQHTVTTSQTNFPQSLFMYHVLDGPDSNGEVHGLRGTISLRNHGAEFSEVLWELAYWQGSCPVDDQSLAGANIFWTEIQKNPNQSEVTLPVDLHFPDPLPMTGCIGLIFAGGPLVQGAAAVTMSADLHLEYRRSGPPTNAVIGLAGEYCFGQNWGCQNATVDSRDAFAVPIQVPAGHLVELYGSISDSPFDGTENFGPLPKGQVWGAINDLYLLPGGCGQFGDNLNSQGFPNPTPLATLYSWLPHDAIHLDSVPMDYQIPQGGTSKAPLTREIEALLPYPVKVDAGDCVVVIYGRKGNGATDNETQVNAVLAP
ncbi:MAG TPA: hypothetical protein VIC29_16635 [Steroidobacteraceae bacterium]|jgi:hypothetical protein